MDATADQIAFTEQATEIVAAYVSHNSVPLTEVPNLIRSVHEALSSLDKSADVEAPAEAPKPAVPIKRSITDEYLVSLEDGRKFKSLKRYLMTSFGMTPEDYRRKWGLPADYPMVAPAYAKARSALAKESGLGQQRRKTAQSAPAPAVEPDPETEAPAPKRRGRQKAP